MSEHAPGAEPYDRTAAVRAVLEQDDSLLGRIYGYDVAGMSPREIADEEGNQGVAFVYNYRLQIEALVSGEVPSSPWAARAVAAKLRKWLATLDLSPRLREDLTKFEATLRSRAEDPEAEAAEVDQAVAKTAAGRGSGCSWHLCLHAAALPEAPDRSGLRQDAAQGRSFQQGRLLPRWIGRAAHRIARGPDPAAHLSRRGLRRA